MAVRFVDACFLYIKKGNSWNLTNQSFFLYILGLHLVVLYYEFFQFASSDSLFFIE